MKTRYKVGDTLYITVDSEIGLYTVVASNRKSVSVVPIVAEDDPWNNEMAIATPLMWSKETRCWTLYGLPIYKVSKKKKKIKNTKVKYA